MKAFNTLTKQILDRWVAKSLTKVGSSKEVRLVFCGPQDSEHEYFNLSLDPRAGKYDLFMSVNMVNLLNNNQFLACVGHEIGHLFHDRFEPDKHRREFIADRMSVRFGNDPHDLIGALLVLSRDYRPMVNESSKCHPSIKLRAAALNISAESIDNWVRKDILGI